MKFQSFNIVQDKISELDLLEKAQDIQDIFFQWSDDNDLYLNISLGTEYKIYPIPIWDLFRNILIRNSWTTYSLEEVIDNFSKMPILFIEFGLGEDLRMKELDYVETKSNELEEVRIGFLERLKSAYNFEILYENYNQIGHGWCTSAMKNRTAIAFRIAIKI